MKKIILGFVAIIAFLISYIFITWDKTFEADLPSIKASSDSLIIARGRYLAYGPAHCSSCHVPMEKLLDGSNDENTPLSGGWELNIPPGVFRAPNLTPDKETGIGNLSDGQIARALRYSVNHKDQLLFPFMPFQEISDDDLTAIISFLKAQKPVKHYVEPTTYNLIGKAILAFGVIKPEGPKKTPPTNVKIDSTIEYGSYLANSVANCYGCHTERNVSTGEFIGVPFAGGLKIAGGSDRLSYDYSFVTPNITPDRETGIMTTWDEKMFINRFKSGRVYKGSPMPWESYSRMNEIELKAIYRYLKSLSPVKNRINKIVFNPDEEI